MPATSPQATPAQFDYLVENMDCADCARKVQNVVGRLPGVSDSSVNFTTQVLRVELNESLTPRASLERDLRNLGYPPSLRSAEKPTAPPPSSAAQSWYSSSKGRLVITTGALLAVSTALALLFPSLAPWGFGAATLIGVWPLAKKAWASTRLGEPFTINTLISLAAIGAVAIGETAEGAIVVFFFAIGELLESVAAGRARAGIRALAALTPRTALLLEVGSTREVSVEELEVGEMVQVRPGARVPTDGVITAGSANVDDSPVTGESVPSFKGEGASVFAGSISTDGVLTVRVEKRTQDSTISRIIHLVEEAQSGKAPVARFIDRFSRVYTPGAMLVASLVAVAPPVLFGASWEEWLYKGIAILLIACPCALVLSVPAAITSGISAGARHGLLIKGGATLEAIGSVTTVAFDKTGTLTENRPRVTDVVALNGTENDVLRLAAAVEAGSVHPLARAIVERARELEVPTAENGRALPGKAATATIDGRPYSVGSPRYAAELAPLPAGLPKQLETFENEGKTVVVVLEGATPIGLVAIRDDPRPDARAAIERLKHLGVRSLMLTGDNALTGNAVGLSLGLEVRSELLPEEKLQVIDELRRSGKVAMVGDGINDAPALARADVSIAMGGGTDVALETANAALLRERVQGVGDLVELSRATMRNIRQNVIFALGLKAVFLVTTLVGLTGLWPAILSDTGATALVTANALRLLRFKPRQEIT